MKGNFLYALLGVTFFLFNVVYANNPSLGRVMNHREWVTGNLKIKYTISDPKQEKINNINHKFVKSKFADEVKEYVHFGHLITSIDTKYDYPYQTITKIDSAFYVEIHGFETTNEAQLFTVFQETCIVPRGDSSNDQLTCVNTEDTIIVDESLVLNIRNLNINAYNLKPGKYTVSTEMIIRQTLPQPQSTIAYTTSNTVAFTVKENL